VRKEKELSTWRISGAAFALTLVVAVVWVGCALIRQQSEGVTAERPDHKTTLSEQTTPPNTKPAASLPAEDVPGKDVPDLPRYPGSVRVEYERKGQDRLVFTKVRYLSHAKLDVIRGFYRGVFRAEGWKVANVEFSNGVWTFLVVKVRREVDMEIKPHDPGIEVDIELSEPLTKEEIDSKERPQKRKANPAPQESASPQPSQSATPTPQPASPAPHPAPVPDSYEGGGEDWDDRGDD
jgi:hypothetical protein